MVVKKNKKFKKPVGYYGFAFDKDMQIKPEKFKRYQKQREKYGFDDTELWNLDNTIACFIIPRLERFIKVKCSQPSEMKSEEWDNILNKILNAFKKIRDDDHFMHTKADQVIIDEGLQLFAKYLQNLWD